MAGLRGGGKAGVLGIGIAVAAVAIVGIGILGVLLHGSGSTGGSTAVQAGQAGSPRDVPSSAPTAAVTAPATPAEASILDVPVGRCIDRFATGTVASVRVIACEQPHAAEVYAAIPLGAGTFPGRATLQPKAEQACKAQFAEFVGKAYDDSKLQMQFVTPTAQSWATKHTSAQCLVAEADGAHSTGSLRNARR